MIQIFSQNKKRLISVLWLAVLWFFCQSLTADTLSHMAEKDCCLDHDNPELLLQHHNPASNYHDLQDQLNCDSCFSSASIITIDIQSSPARKLISTTLIGDVNPLLDPPLARLIRPPISFFS